MAILASLVARAAAQSGDQWDARITDFTGDVTVMLDDGSTASSSRADATGLPLTAKELPLPVLVGDRIVTGRGARVELAFGPDSLFEIGADSKFIVGRLEKQESSLSLLAGLVAAKIRSLLGSGARLEVRTPVAVASVRGTEFAVEHGRGGDTIGVFDEGKVAVSPPEGTSAFAQTELAPNEQAELKGGKSLRKGPLGPRLNSLRVVILTRLRRQAGGGLARTWKPMGLEERQDRRQGRLQRQRDRQKAPPPAPPRRGSLRR